jgi:hypothetical protein
MPTTNSNLVVIAAVLILLFLAGLAALYIQRRRTSDRLKQRFGPEYERTVEQLGDSSRAEADLVAREKRVDRFHIIPLTAADAERFRLSWNTLQGRFVDSPNGAVAQADQLVCELMLKRGYPMGDFERRAADISVDHPAVVANYRAARAIALRDKRGESTTEDLRKAVVHYRALFDELLEVAHKPSLAPARGRERFSVQS